MPWQCRLPHLALCWHILRRNADDFGRDYYTFTLAVSPAGAEVIPELPDQTTESEAKP